MYAWVMRELFKTIVSEYKVDLNEKVVCWHETGKDLDLEGDEYALLRGKEILLTCRYRDSIGQVFTVAPRSFTGTLKEVLELEPYSIVNNSIMYSTLNAVLRHLGLIQKTMHCRGDKPRRCGELLVKQLIRDYGLTARILHVGYQPGHVEALVEAFKDNVIVTDLSEDIIWTKRYGRLIVDGELNKYFVDKVDVVLMTASAIVNNTAWEIIRQAQLSNTKIIVYGISASSAIYILRKILGTNIIEEYCPYAE